MHRFLKQLEQFPTFSKHLVQKVHLPLAGAFELELCTHCVLNGSQVKEKSEQGNDGIFFGDADYRGVVWSITQTLFPRSLVPGQFKFIDLHPYVSFSFFLVQLESVVSLLVWSRAEVVASLTMTEFNLFRNIRLREFLDKTWLTEQMSSLVYVMVLPATILCPLSVSRTGVLLKVIFSR
jgi:hypothetical protein